MQGGWGRVRRGLNNPGILEMRERDRRAMRAQTRNVRRIRCNATERNQCKANAFQSRRTYKRDTTALPDHGEKQESKAGYDMKTEGLNESASEELALGNTFFAG